MVSAAGELQALDATKVLVDRIESHPAFNHPLFAFLESQVSSKKQLGALLKNYDAHACVLRRLLLKAATIMPEPAVGFVLENVRNEYGSGDFACNHQSQLRDVARGLGITSGDFAKFRCEPGVRRFISRVHPLYFPRNSKVSPRAAVSAGAITATEVMALREFIFLQKAFAPYELEHHVWFDHVTVEAEHSHESLCLALYFFGVSDNRQAVLFGLDGVLEANMDLYDGLLSALQNNQATG